MPGHPALHDGAYGVQHIPGRQIVAGRQFGLSGGFRMSLLLHEPVARVPELKPRRRVDGVVDTAVTGNKATQQGGIGGIDNRVHAQPGNIPLP